MNEVTFSAEQIAAIRAVAAEDAVGFANEFDEAFDFGGSDWDAVAWGEGGGWHKSLGDDATEEERKAGFPIYSEHLSAETKRLAAK